MSKDEEDDDFQKGQGKNKVTAKDKDGNGIDDDKEVKGKNKVTDKDKDGNGVDDDKEVKDTGKGKGKGKNKVTDKDKDGNGIDDAEENKEVDDGKVKGKGKGKNKVTDKDKDGNGVDDDQEVKDTGKGKGKNKVTDKDKDGNGVDDDQEVKDTGKGKGKNKVTDKDKDGNGVDDDKEVKDTGKGKGKNKVTDKDKDGNGVDDDQEVKDTGKDKGKGKNKVTDKDKDGNGVDDDKEVKDTGKGKEKGKNKVTDKDKDGNGVDDDQETNKGKGKGKVTDKDKDGNGVDDDQEKDKGKGKGKVTDKDKDGNGVDDDKETNKGKGKGKVTDKDKDGNGVDDDKEKDKDQGKNKGKTNDEVDKGKGKGTDKGKDKGKPNDDDEEDDDDNDDGKGKQQGKGKGKGKGDDEDEDEEEDDDEGKGKGKGKGKDNEENDDDIEYKDEEIEDQENDEEINDDFYDNDYEDDQKNTSNDKGKPRTFIEKVLKSIQNLNEDDKVRYLKKKQRQQERHISQLREVNNKQRDELKNQAKELEKLVDQNVKKQVQQESQQQAPYNYMAEQQILKEILDNKKTKDDFKDIIDPQILDKLRDIQKQIASNNEKRAEIQSIRAKSKNLNYVEKIRDLTNVLTMKEKQKTLVEENKNKLDLVLREQSILLQQLLKDFNYKEKLDELQKEQKEEKEKLKQRQIESIVLQKKYKDQQDLFATVESLYRKTSKQLNQFGNPMDLQSDVIATFKGRNSKLGAEEQPKTRASELKYQPKKQEEVIDQDVQKLAEEFKKNKEIQKQTIEKLRQLQKDQEANEKVKKQKMILLQNQIAKFENEIKELNKKHKEKEHESNIAFSKLTEIKRILVKKNLYKETDLSLSTVLNTKIVNQKDDFKKSLLKQIIEPRGRGYLRFAGGIFQETESTIIFDDSLALIWRQDPPKLVEMIVYHSKKGTIYGIQGRYRVNDKDVIDGPLNHQQYNNVEVEKTILKIKEGDYLRFISGFFNEQIFYLRIETHLREHIEIGDLSQNDSNKAQEFRLDVRKEQIPIALIGILDYTSLSKKPQDRFLVALGIELKLPFDPLRRQKEKDRDEIEEEIQLSDEREQEENEVRTRRIVEARKKKIHLKKNENKSLLVIPHEPLQYDPKDPHYQFQQQQKLRQEKVKLELSPPKAFNPSSYKNKQYLDEERKRRDLSLIREKKVEEYVEQSKSVKLLLQTPKSPPKKEVKSTTVQVSPKPALPQKKK